MQPPRAESRGHTPGRSPGCHPKQAAGSSRRKQVSSSDVEQAHRPLLAASAAPNSSDVACGPLSYTVGNLALRSSLPEEFAPSRDPSSPATRPDGLAVIVGDLRPGFERERYLTRVHEQEAEREYHLAMATFLERIAEWQAFTTCTFAPVRKQLAVARLLEQNNVAPLDDGRASPRPQDKSIFCRRVFHCFVGDLNRAAFSRRQIRNGESVQIFVPWELQKWGALHCHPLIANLPKGWRYKDIHAAWRSAQENYGLGPGRAHVLPYSRGDITSYVAKYVTKDVTGDLWDLIGFRTGEGSPLPMRQRTGWHSR